MSESDQLRELVEQWREEADLAVEADQLEQSAVLYEKAEELEQVIETDN